MRRLTNALISGVLAAVVLGGAGGAAAQQTFKFIGVGEEPLWLEADSVLRDLIVNSGRRFEFEAAPELLSLPYDDAIETLVEWPASALPFLARTTPYVFAAAELRGARFNIIAVVRSAATHEMTYHSYFVVNRERYGSHAHDIAGVQEYLNARRVAGQEVEFIYHNRFSTSSYFLPSLFFRQNNISSGGGGFATRKIDSQSSKDLVRQVANQSGDQDVFAAVWTGTSAYFETTTNTEDSASTDDVIFIELPTELPNDLLVVPSTYDPPDDLIAAFQGRIIGIDDFESWTSVRSDEGRVAQAALAELRWSARERAAPLVVDFDQGGDAIADSILEAARMAVRLSGGEFTVYDSVYHDPGAFDYQWTIELPHDQAATLRSKVRFFDQVQEQEFHLSYRGLEDLTGRIGTVMRTRLHRVRYLWPYNNETPTILRDVDFALERGDTAFVLRVEVEDALRARIRVGGAAQAVSIREADLYTFELDSAEVQSITQANTQDGGLGLDPMSRVAYRVLLVRPAEERVIFKVLTVVMLGLFALAAWWAVRLDLMRLVAARRDRALHAPPPVPNAPAA